MTVRNDQASVWLDQVWAALDGAPGATEQVRITGPLALLPSVYDVGALAAASVAAATLAVAELGARRGWTAGAGSDVPEVEIDRFAAAAVFRSEALLRPLGWELPSPWDSVAGDYLAADGWIRLHTNYPYHRTAALRALGLEPRPEVDREQVSERVGRMQVQELEQTVVAAGGCAAVLHTADEWAVHPHGAIAKAEPAVRLQRRSGAVDRAAPPSRPEFVAGAGPLTGLRVLDLTRVLAGPICTRTLAAWGADVLRVDPVGFAEVPALLPDTTVGKRCAEMDLRGSKDHDRFAELVGEADVVVHGLRPGALAGLGFGDDELRRLNPELTIASVNAYGWSGPWADRRGFDSLMQFSCGIAAAGGAAAGSDRPVPLPAQALDHAAGYLLAAAVCRGLTGRHDGLAAADVRASLVGVANMLMQQPLSLTPTSSEVDFSAATVVRQTEWGSVRAVAQPGTIGGSAGSWRVPAGPLGRHSPIFVT